MKTNRILKLITLSAAIFGFAATSFGQITASDDAGAFATIIKPITLTKVDDLQFGVIAADADGGSVVVAAATGTATPSGVILYTAGNNAIAPSAASFDVTGEASYTYKITLPSSVTLTRNGGGTMSVGTFKTNTPSESLTGNTFNEDGEASFKVGGTLTIGANQVAGLYEGTLSVTVDYE